jgi:hypothetical protein
LEVSGSAQTGPDGSGFSLRQAWEKQSAQKARSSTAGEFMMGFIQ